MQDAHVVTLPAVSEKGVLEGLITVGDITKILHERVRQQYPVQGTYPV